MGVGIKNKAKRLTEDKTVQDHRNKGKIKCNLLTLTTLTLALTVSSLAKKTN